MCEKEPDVPPLTKAPKFEGQKNKLMVWSFLNTEDTSKVI